MLQAHVASPSEKSSMNSLGLTFLPAFLLLVCPE